MFQQIKEAINWVSGRYRCWKCGKRMAIDVNTPCHECYQKKRNHTKFDEWYDCDFWEQTDYFGE